MGGHFYFGATECEYQKGKYTKHYQKSGSISDKRLYFIDYMRNKFKRVSNQVFLIKLLYRLKDGGIGMEKYN